ncbi:MutS-related protein [Anaeromicropila populeti]|uniref:MutS domain V n=1 Tax=Anaeromicropila populeti TaxID=37658 RepID=A0A1I6L7G0_9FIRM|nr:hypothetical protein [Anaeromicropila populeti]SFR99443.1 MutS domain V [Anaeromicropila populeti]
MEYVIGVFAVLLILFIKILYDARNTEKQNLYMLKKGWGNVPQQEYTDEKFQSLKYYYLCNRRENLDVDDITWNDVDMDSIFMLLNNTKSSIGEEYLYSILHHLEYSKEELEKREELIQLFQKNEVVREKLQASFLQMGKLHNISFYQYVSAMKDIVTKKTYRHHILAACLIGCLGWIFVAALSGFTLAPAIIGTIAFVCINIVQYYKRKAEIEKYFTVLSYILRLLYSVKKIVKLGLPELKKYETELQKNMKAFQKFQSQARFLFSGKNMTGSLADVILDYEKMLFHTDLIKFDNMVLEVKNKQNELNQLFEIIGLLDSMLAVASFRALVKEHYCSPVLKKGSRPEISIDGMYHPMISEPVANSISEKQCVLITGSNASGKSTFIKTIAINAILAQTIHTCLCEKYEASYFKVYSSMALQDNLLGKESYYIVEIKSLKRIMDQLTEEIPTLCFVDEVLRGTNTLERIAASSQILKGFSRGNVICFAATHDIELTYILEKYYSNYHFQEQIKDNEILFDYTLYKGRAVSRNAIKLLEIMGYEKEIIEQATKEANTFLEKGVWNAI